MNLNSDLIVTFNSNFKVRKNYFEGLLNLGLSRTYKWKKNFVVPCQKRMAKALHLHLLVNGS
jgi:hypothetical protein